MKDNFDKAVNFVLSWEGGYCDDPGDPGGETNFGICKRAYPDLDIRHITKEIAKEIYRQDYWDDCKCDNLPWPFDMIVFDTAVNMGSGRAIALFDENNDSWQNYLMARISRYNDIAARGNNGKFLRGWINRVVSIWRVAKNGGTQ